MPIIRTLGFETGDLSEFDSTSDANGKLSATPAAALVGSFGLQVDHDLTAVVATGTTSGLVLPLTPWRFIFQFDPNSMANLGGARRTGMVQWQGTAFEIAIDGPGIAPFELYVSPLGAGVQLVPLTDAPHQVEVRVDPAGGGAGLGTIRTWVDNDSSKPPSTEHTGLTLAAWTTAAWGAPTSDQFVTAPGSFFMDEIVISDDDEPLVPKRISRTMVGTDRPYGFAVVPGGPAATPLGPAGGLDVGDALVSVFRVADPPAGITDVTADASIPAADTIELATTDSTGAFLLVTWYLEA